MGWLTGLLPILTACDFKRITAKPRSDGFVVVGTVSELNQSAGHLQLQAGNTQFIVVGRSAQPQTTVALNPTCPHAGCDVQWKNNQSQFVCPYHGSEFDSRGQVTRGPAGRALASYPLKVEDQAILVKLD